MVIGPFPNMMLGLGVNPCDADAFNALSSAGVSPPSSIPGRRQLPTHACGRAGHRISPDPLPVVVAKLGGDDCIDEGDGQNSSPSPAFSRSMRRCTSSTTA